jgi:hypothetical protein
MPKIDKNKFTKRNTNIIDKSVDDEIEKIERKKSYRGHERGGEEEEERLKAAAIVFVFVFVWNNN